MSEENEDAPSLRELINAAIAAYCQQDGFGLPVGFVYLVTHIDGNGEQLKTAGSADGQTTELSLGMSSYLSEIYRREAQAELEASGW